MVGVRVKEQIMVTNLKVLCHSNFCLALETECLPCDKHTYIQSTPY